MQLSTNCRGIKAFSLIEILSCIVIIAILSAILYPVLVKTKLEAKASAAKLNLKNLHLAFTLYRNDYEGLEFGDSKQMGLPDPASMILIDLIRKTSGQDYKRQSPCGFHPKSKDNTFHYYPSSPANWNQWVNKLESRTVLIGDANCNTSDVDIESQFVMKRSIGVALDGHVTTVWNDDVMYSMQEFYLRGTQ